MCSRCSLTRTRRHVAASNAREVFMFLFLRQPPLVGQEKKKKKEKGSPLFSELAPASLMTINVVTTANH